MDPQEFRTLDRGATFVSASKPYVTAPIKKLLKFHVGPFETTEQINKFKKTPSGDDNPDYGKPQPVLIFKGVLDSSVKSENGDDAKGQLYTSWITGYYKDDDPTKPVYSMGERSKLGKIAEALAGSVEAFSKLTAGEIEGMPFQCSLAPGKKNPERLVLDIDKIMPPADDQVRVEPDVVLADIDEAQAEEAVMAAIDALGGEEVKA
jgi:hypothetical protein